MAGRRTFRTLTSSQQSGIKSRHIIFLHGLGRLTCSAIDALPSFPWASTVSSSSGFVVEGVFRESPPCLGGGGLAALNDLTGYAGGNFLFLVRPPKPDRP